MLEALRSLKPHRASGACVAGMTQRDSIASPGIPTVPFGARGPSCEQAIFAEQHVRRGVPATFAS